MLLPEETIRWAWNTHSKLKGLIKWDNGFCGGLKAMVAV